MSDRASVVFAHCAIKVPAARAELGGLTRRRLLRLLANFFGLFVLNCEGAPQEL
jgi:hypothetical protein